MKSDKFVCPNPPVRQETLSGDFTPQQPDDFHMLAAAEAFPRRELSRAESY